MTHVVGMIEPYRVGTNFAAYEDRVKQMFIVNEVAEAGKTPLFITIMGSEMYEVATSLASPRLPSELNFLELMMLLKEHFMPRVNIRAERYKFYNMKQEVGESLNDYIVRLKSAARTCKFGDFWDADNEQAKFDQTALDDALIDKFITSIRDGRLYQRLLKDDDDEFEEVCKTALNWEMTEKEVNAMRSTIGETKAIRQKPRINQSVLMWIYTIIIQVSLVEPVNEFLWNHCVVMCLV